MLRKPIRLFLPTLVQLSLSLILFVPVNAQDKRSGTPAPQLIKRTVIKRDSTRVGYGSTITLVGAPQGSISIEGWSRSELELTAEIELQAENEADLDGLALVNGFIFEEQMNHVRILTLGTHDKKYMKRVAKNFPKKLLNLPWKIDYRIRVPEACDLEINAGRGPITIKGVDGSLSLTATESVTDLTLSSGVANVTIGSGKLDVQIPVRSWRGSGIDLKLAVGDMTVELPAGFNGEMEATILRNGKINDSFGELEPVQRNSITPQVVRARAGAGGATFKFTVADGSINIKKSGL